MKNKVDCVTCFILQSEKKYDYTIAQRKDTGTAAENTTVSGSSGTNEKELLISQKLLRAGNRT